MLIAKEVLKELLIFLVMVQVVWLLIPSALKNIITRITRALGKGYKGINHHVKKRVRRSLKQRKKATPVLVEQPHENVIKVIYPNQKVKKYYNVK